jgi:hypothetical protein
MTTCAKCGYELQPFESECPKCKRLGEQTPVQPRAPEGVEQTARPPADQHGEPAAAGPTEPGPQRAQPAQGSLTASGVVAGAIYGAVLLTTYALMDRWFFGGSESAGLGLIGTVLLGAIAGAVLGAIIGGATMAARSTAAGIAAGALAIGAAKGLGMSLSGFGAGFAVMGLVVGLVYGALIGWVVSTSVIKSIKWP